MEGTIVSFRRNRHTTRSNQMIVKVPGVDNKEKAEALVGKNVKYNTGVKDIKGKVSSAHGNSGAVRVIFETGMPGQSLTGKVTLA